MKLFLLFPFILVTSCAGITKDYVAPKGQGDAIIRYDASAAIDPPTIFLFRSFECKSAEFVGLFYDESGNRINLLETRAEPGKEFINTFRFHTTTFDSFAGGLSDKWNYTTVSFAELCSSCTKLSLPSNLQVPKPPFI